MLNKPVNMSLKTNKRLNPPIERSVTLPSIKDFTFGWCFSSNPV